MASWRSKRFIAATTAAVMAVVFAQAAYPAPTASPSTTAKSTPTLSPKPEGDRLVRLLKKIADEALVLHPELMAKELGIAMTFETKPSSYQSKPCEAGGEYKSFFVTTAKVTDSWYRETPEGVPDMKIPPAFINPGATAGQPQVHYDAYQAAQCRSPSYIHLEYRLSFSNLSGFSCLTPGRLENLIGAKYSMATDGVSLWTYSPPATFAYGISLEFTFRAGAPCAVRASIDLNSRSGLREMRAFLKWRTCFDNARRDFCKAHNWKATEAELQQHGNEACEDREAYIEREPVEGDSVITWPTFPPMSDNPCNDYLQIQK